MKEGKTASKTYLVEVLPISKSPFTGYLSYFSGTKIPLGTLVRVPIRNKLTPALVVSAKDVRSAKSDIRRAGFLLKKIRTSDILGAAINAETLKALEICARYYATNIGTLLATLLPKLVSDDPTLFLPTSSAQKKKSFEPLTRDPLLLQMESEERFGQYRALVRQCFARNTSVTLVVPTHLDAARLEKELSTGIAEFVYTFTLEKKAAAKRVWLEALANKHPVLFITTPAGLFFHRPDLDMIIIERHNSRAYRSFTRPFLDLKIFVAQLAKETKRQLVLGDSVLPIETLWREKNGEYGENSLIRWRLTAAPATIVDAATKQNEHGGFQIFSQELKALIEKALSEKQRIFLFGARKGLAPTTVCGDCGTVLPCLNCGAPVVLHHRDDANIYVCHSCGSKREPGTLCGMCHSWRLVPLGIGTEEIARQAAEIFPGTPIRILDKDHAPTDKQARVIAEEFTMQGGILVGTELAFFHLDSVPYSGLVSIDALFSIPDFYINERVFYLVSRLRELTKTECLVQTRNIGRQLLAWATQGNITDFYLEEMRDREALLYPPFSIFIKIVAPKDYSREKLSQLQEVFREWHPDIFRQSLVMRIPRANWPDAALSEKLALLSPEFSIKVDPESIL